MFHPALLSSDGLHGFFDFRRSWVCHLWAVVDGDPGKGVRIIAMWSWWSRFWRHQSMSLWAVFWWIKHNGSWPCCSLNKSRFMVLGLAVWILHVELFMGRVFPFLTFDWVLFLLFLFHVNFSFITHLVVFSWILFPSRKIHVSRTPTLHAWKLKLKSCLSWLFVCCLMLVTMWNQLFRCGKSVHNSVLGSALGWVAGCWKCSQLPYALKSRNYQICE